MTPSSKELLEMANTEWKNREERKGIHDRISWTSGWISGYLTRNQAVRQFNEKITSGQITSPPAAPGGGISQKAGEP